MKKVFSVILVVFVSLFCTLTLFAQRIDVYFLQPDPLFSVIKQQGVSSRLIPALVDSFFREEHFYATLGTDIPISYEATRRILLGAFSPTWTENTLLSLISAAYTLRVPGATLAQSDIALSTEEPKAFIQKELEQLELNVPYGKLDPSRVIAAFPDSFHLLRFFSHTSFLQQYEIPLSSVELEQLAPLQKQITTLQKVSSFIHRSVPITALFAILSIGILWLLHRHSFRSLLHWTSAIAVVSGILIGTSGYAYIAPLQLFAEKLQTLQTLSPDLLTLIRQVSHAYVWQGAAPLFAIGYILLVVSALLLVSSSLTKKR